MYTDNTSNIGNVLIVDDEPNALKILSAILSDKGFRIFDAMGMDSAITLMHKHDIDAIITDIKMTGGDGMVLFHYVKQHFSEIPVIFLTAYGNVDSAVSAITQGAFYYFIKPPDYMKLKGILARAVEQRQLRKEVRSLKTILAVKEKNHFIIGNNNKMRKILELIDSVKDSSSSVLIRGETGTGKELVARALHFTSRKKTTPFVDINCAAVPRDLLESELFGYEKGAFTGAFSQRTGKFEEASGGTLFLDEISELELSLQTKLLRVLQEREVERLGSNKRIKIDFRLICSANKDIRQEVREERFRDDLFYRINVIEIALPPLRERKDDLPLLVTEFMKEFCIRENKSISVSSDAMEILRDYYWPGNVRQLRNIIERAVVLASGQTLTIRDLPNEILSTYNHKPDNNSMRSLKEMEIQAVRNAIHECQGNKSKAARMLGISRKAFYKRLRELSVKSHV
ncbi:MAG: sigma-54 dependent transcriptional regulator [Thermodesulfovibrionales bacterium]|nr:sigma-54 dependent transcriptional regulator [Thermodesulfovibrionales bacterium]